VKGVVNLRILLHFWGMKKRVKQRSLLFPLKKRIKRLLYGPHIEETDLIYELLQADRQPGVMVDVGAHHGGALAPFAAVDWEIFAFEPDVKNRSVLERAIRENDWSQVAVDTRAVSNTDDQELPFFTSEVSTGISGLADFHDTHVATDTVTTVQLGTFLKEKKVGQIDLLKIDTEGYDLFVLQGMDWSRPKPRAIICEFEDRKTLPLGYSYQDLISYLQEVGYRVLISEWEPIVEYGRRHRWRRFAKADTPLAEKAWGNLLAVRPAYYPSLVDIARKSGPVE
jgi:FkbM family methyltransferase